MVFIYLVVVGPSWPYHGRQFGEHGGGVTATKIRADPKTILHIIGPSMKNMTLI